MDDLKHRFPVYSRLLKLYPLAYRRQYEAQMLQTAADMLDDAPAGQRFEIWTRLIFDLPFAIAKQQLYFAGAVMKNDMPRYIKINGFITGLLLVPFFIALAANALNKVLYHHDLYASWLWSYNVLRVWVLVLPTIALLFALVNFAIYLAGGLRRPKQSLAKWILNWRRNWPIVATGLVALGIIFIVRFHDSWACYLQIPIHYLAHTHQSQVCSKL